MDKDKEKTKVLVKAFKKRFGCQCHPCQCDGDCKDAEIEFFKMALELKDKELEIAEQAITMLKQQLKDL